MASSEPSLSSGVHPHLKELTEYIIVELELEPPNIVGHLKDYLRGINAQHAYPPPNKPHQLQLLLANFVLYLSEEAEIDEDIIFAHYQQWSRDKAASGSGVEVNALAISIS